jgi:ATP-dependent Clp protease ATP-binding subunit ClpB
MPIQNTKIKIETYKQEADVAEREGDYGKVAELSYGKIKEANNNLFKLELEQKA